MFHSKMAIKQKSDPDTDMFHFEEKTEGRRGTHLFAVMAKVERWKLARSLPDKVVETSETVTAEALPVLVSLLLVRLPRRAVRVA